jgi:hypothetical protein
MAVMATPACHGWPRTNGMHFRSVLENPRDPNKQQVFMLNCGNWMNAVNDALQ